MNENSSKELFAQVRIAHRLLAAYYESTHSFIDKISSHKSLDLHFYYWKPSRFARPKNKSKSPLKKFSWDFLPGVLTEYVFLHGVKKDKKLGDWILRINVVSDSSIETGPVKNPLEITIPPEEGRSLLRFYIVAPRKHVDGNWYARFNAHLKKTDVIPESRLEEICVNAKCVDKEDNIYACIFCVSMEEITDEGSAEKLVEKIMDARDSVLGEETDS